MLENIIFLVMNSFLWGWKPLLEKSIVRSANYVDISLLRYVLGGIICIFLILILNKPNILYKYSPKIYLGLSFVAFIAFLALFANYYLLSKYDAYLVNAVVNALSTIVTMILGYIFYKESVSFARGIGVIIISIGIFIVYYNK